MGLWLKEYNTFNSLAESDFKDYTLEKLREVTKQMYLSPLDYGDIYSRMKERLDTAEMIKLNLKRIL